MPRINPIDAANASGLSARAPGTGGLMIVAMTNSKREWPLLALRIVVGYGFLAHGLAKATKGPAAFSKLLHVVGVPIPAVAAWAVMLLEILGGIALLVGLFIAVASVPLIASMIVAMFTVHLRNGFSAINTIGLTPSGPVYGPPGFEINLLYVAALLVLAILGPGPLALRVRSSRRP